MAHACLSVCARPGRLANGRKVVAEWNRVTREALGSCDGHGCLREASKEAQALLGPKGAVWSRRYDNRNESLVGGIVMAGCTVGLYHQPSYTVTMYW
jgi:hypothetical protein